MMNLKEICTRVDVAKINLEDFSKSFKNFIDELFLMEIDYSFIKNDLLQERLKNHSLRMSLYRLGLGNNSDDSFANYCMYVYHQLDGLSNYYFSFKDIDELKHLFIQMNIKNYLRYLPKEKKVNYWQLISDSGIEDTTLEILFLKDYQNLSSVEFIEKYNIRFLKLSLPTEKNINNLFTKSVWKIDNKIQDVERIDFQHKLNLILNEIHKDFNFLSSPIKKLSDWRNSELMHTSSKEPNKYVEEFKNKKDFLHLFVELQNIRNHIEQKTTSNTTI